MREELVERNLAKLVSATAAQMRVTPWSSEEARRLLESARADGHVM